jgi:cell division protein FtsQ
MVMALGAGAYQGVKAVQASRSLQLRTVEVVGNTDHRVDKRVLIAVAGVTKGERLLGISTETAANRISALPWIAEAKVERILPSTLRISVVERRPAMVVMSGTGPYLVDPAGMVLDQGTENLLRLVDVPVNNLRPGVEIEQPEFKQALRIYNSLPMEIRKRVSTIHAATVDQITLVTFEGLAVRYGAAEQIQDKNYALGALIDKAVTDHAKILDVSAPARPAITP